MSNEPTRHWWRLGPWAWCGLLLILLGNIAVFTDWLVVDRHTVAWLVYCGDPHRWPMEIGYLLWGAVLWMALGLPRWPKWVHQFRWVALTLFVIGVLTALFLQYDVHTLAVRRKIYNGFYLKYFVSPYTNYLVDGRLHWTMLITPLTGATALGSLIYLAVRLRRKSNHVETIEHNQQ